MMTTTSPESCVASAVDKILHERRTINFFQSELPPRGLILKGIEAARWAPNHHLTEPWHFYLLSGQARNAIVELNAELVAKAKGTKAADAKRRRWSAIPGWLVVTCDRSNDEIRSREDYAACCCAVHSLALFLWSYEVGMKWTTGDVIRDPRFYELIWADPVQEQVVGLMWYGYPAEFPTAQRKPVSDIVIEI